MRIGVLVASLKNWTFCFHKKAGRPYDSIFTALGGEKEILF